jgi:hypothetical protein
MESTLAVHRDRFSGTAVVGFFAWLYLVASWLVLVGAAGRIYNAVTKPATHPWDLAIATAISNMLSGIILFFLGVGLHQRRRWAFRAATAGLFCNFVQGALLLPRVVEIHGKLEPALHNLELRLASSPKLNEIFLLVYPAILSVWAIWGIALILLGRPSVFRRISMIDRADNLGRNAPWPFWVLIMALLTRITSNTIPIPVGIYIFGHRFQGFEAWALNTCVLAVCVFLAIELLKGTRLAWIMMALWLVLCCVSALMTFQEFGSTTLLAMQKYQPMFSKLGVQIGDLSDPDFDYFLLKVDWGLKLIFVLVCGFWVTRRADRQTQHRPV